MDTLFMNFKNNKRFDPYRLLLNLTDEINLSINVSSKYSQKLVDLVKQSAKDALKTASRKAFQKTAEAFGNLIGNKIADKITNVSNTSPRNSSETVTNEEKRYISLEERQKIIGGLRLI